MQFCSKQQSLCSNFISIGMERVWISFGYACGLNSSGNQLALQVPFAFCVNDSLTTFFCHID